MNQRISAQGILWFLVGVVVAVSCASAAPLQVPSLPTQTAGYVSYAVTNLSNNYKNLPPNLNNATASNPLTDAGATLGRVLFYDKRLSHSNGVSCSSCHRQSNGFSDPNQFSQGVNGQTTRHSMGLSNATYYASGKAFWDERAASLEAQALVPIQNSIEMGSTLNEVVTKLNQTTFYPTLFKAAFGTSDINSDRISKAMAQFKRSMVSYKSKYDDFLANGPQALSQDEMAGRNLFNGAAKCNACHTTDAHVSNGVHNIGLEATTVDSGAGNGQFKAPSLRNVAVRGKFMHDGRFSSLLEVVQFYNSKIQSNTNLDPVLQVPQQQTVTPIQLNLTTTQMNQIVAYLGTLTDNTFLSSSLFSDPFVTLPGDYSGDGVVDTADYVLWRANFGDTTSLAADGNGDHIVNNADYDVWRSNFGKTWLSLATGSGSGLTFAAVPEPSAIILVTLLLGWTLNRRSPRRRLRT